MASAKRERQRANREQKREVEAQVQKKTKLVTNGKRLAIWAVVIIITLFLANQVFGGGGDTAAALGVLL